MRNFTAALSLYFEEAGGYHDGQRRLKTRLGDLSLLEITAGENGVYRTDCGLLIHV